MFQSFMNSVLYDKLHDLVLIYLYNILVFRMTKEKHLKHLRFFLLRPKGHERYVWKTKHETMKKVTEFFGLKAGRADINNEYGRKRVVSE